MTLLEKALGVYTVSSQKKELNVMYHLCGTWSRRWTPLDINPIQFKRLVFNLLVLRPHNSWWIFFFLFIFNKKSLGLTNTILCLIQNYDSVSEKASPSSCPSSWECHPEVSLSFFPCKAVLAHAYWPLKSCSTLQKKWSQLCFQAPTNPLLYLLVKSFNGSVQLDHLRLKDMKNFKGSQLYHWFCEKTI